MPCLRMADGAQPHPQVEEVGNCAGQGLQFFLCVSEEPMSGACTVLCGPRATQLELQREVQHHSVGNFFVCAGSYSVAGASRALHSCNWGVAHWFSRERGRSVARKSAVIQWHFTGCCRYTVVRHAALLLQQRDTHTHTHTNETIMMRSRAVASTMELTLLGNHMGVVNFLLCCPCQI